MEIIKLPVREDVMKRSVIVAVLLGSVIMVGMVYARGPMAGGPGGCGMSGCNNAGAVGTEQWKKFRADSIELREQMMTRMFELQRENLKEAPDAAKVAKLEAEITDLRTKIQDIGAEAGLPACGTKGADCRGKGEINCGAGNCGGMVNCGTGAGCGKFSGNRI
jgi:hypothetical protein